MLLLVKEDSGKDKGLKTQPLVAINDEKESEKIWRYPGFFGDQKVDFPILKVNFPENNLCYANQGTISTVKGDFAICLDFVILKQLIPARNSPENTDEHGCKQNEVKIYIPPYDTNIG